VLDPLYVRARAALLDAADALDDHIDALVLVGAQAIYLHTGDTDLAVAEYTTDADFTVSPTDLADAPLLGDLLTAKGFTQRRPTPLVPMIHDSSCILRRLRSSTRTDSRAWLTASRSAGPGRRDQPRRARRPVATTSSTVAGRFSGSTERCGT